MCVCVCVIFLSCYSVSPFFIINQQSIFHSISCAGGYGRSHQAPSVLVCARLRVRHISLVLFSFYSVSPFLIINQQLISQSISCVGGYGRSHQAPRGESEFCGDTRSGYGHVRYVTCLLLLVFTWLCLFLFLFFFFSIYILAVKFGPSSVHLLYSF